MISNAQLIVRELADAGVERVFGLPGGEVAALLEAFRREGIPFYLVGHEASAAFMADVSGQITGRPGVCVSTLGPGAVNLLLGVANAALDRSPVLALTAQTAMTVEGHFPHQRLPLTRLFGALCKSSAIITGKETDVLTRNALALAATPPCGPVHLSLPSDIAERPTLASTPAHMFPATSKKAADGALAEITQMLEAANRALVVVGLGCRTADVPALRHFVDATGVPFVATPKAKGFLPEDAVNFLGVVGGMALDAAIRETLAEADVLLGVGFDPVECDKPWYADRTIANLSFAPTSEGMYRPTEYLGDIAEALADLSRRGLQLAWPVDVLNRCRARIRPNLQMPRSGLSPLAAVQTLREVLPRDTILTCDVGSHKYYAGQFWESYEPGTFYVSNGLSAMGYGIPAAIAAKLHFPHRPTIALVGDGGFLMMLHNLTFLRMYQVPIVVVCFVDGSLSLIEVAQRRRGFQPHGVRFTAPDFPRVAEAFGILGLAVTSLEELRVSLSRCVGAASPSVIAIPVDVSEYERLC